MLHFEQIIHNKFINYSGKGDLEKWLLQTVNQFKQYQLSCTDQLRVIPLLLEDSAYVWIIKNEHLFVSFESFSKLLLQQFSLITSSSSDTISTLMSQLSVTMAREIIKAPTYFRDSKDDILDWLEKLKQRFKMANWDDEHKLRYISIHLPEDACSWWIQAAEEITSWSRFVDDIKQAINQSITQYYGKIIELRERIDPNMTDSMKLQYLMAGVKESLELTYCFT